MDATVRRWLPAGGAIGDAEWRSRHRLVQRFLSAHLVALPIYALLRHNASWQAWAGIGGVALFAAAAAAPLRRRLRMMAASVALLTASGVVVVISDGDAYASFHLMLAITLIALYEDWPTYLASMGYVVCQHVLALGLTPAALRRHGVPVWEATLAHGVLVLLTFATLVLFWHYLHQARERERAAHAELSSGRVALREQMDELTTTREQLIATVSHEFRTPLTAIRGSALTLRRRRSRLDPARTDELLDAIVSNTDRLSRLLENMLAAAESPDTVGWDNADVFEVASEVAMVVHGRHAAAATGHPVAGSARPQPVAVAVPRRLFARIDREALHQVLANLVDNAVVHAAPGSQALLTGVAEGSTVVITVANEAHGIDASTLAGLFEPFTLADASDTRTRAGAGVGLYVVRRLVDAAGGTVSVHSEPGWVSVEVRLPAGDAALPARLVDLRDHGDRSDSTAPPASA
jgi:signal transduction histidine kinase